MTWDKRLHFLSEGRRAENFSAPKNPTDSSGFEPTNLGTEGQHATSRPPKPFTQINYWNPPWKVMQITLKKYSKMGYNKVVLRDSSPTILRGGKKINHWN